ncbi:hypothetical protein NVP1199A_65 [Vibrio phage 1.199.A._10N.286.55.C10]|nr:hypothetical protein NVP1199A_65 [Vibrio phage 1.199.A._10N.286.55.C10]AUR95008.1 hypothetical protein NVP1199B_65 [Vibrio phage 1.199.B._10N.286.55.C10]
MSEDKFTKGPWVARGKTPSRIYGMQRKDKEVIVAATGSVINEAGANAHLIAAAPEMYEFLESLQLDVTNDYKRDEILAKARGEQND